MHNSGVKLVWFYFTFLSQKDEHVRYMYINWFAVKLYILPHTYRNKIYVNERDAINLYRYLRVWDRFEFVAVKCCDFSEKCH